MPALMPLSFSRLSTFESCPAKFDYLYVTKNIKDSDNEYTIYGTRVHDALEQYGKAKIPLPADLEKFAPLVDKILARPGEHLFEQQMAITPDRQPCDWFASDVWLRGIADVLIIDGVRAFCLDWKTGKPKDNPTQLQLFAALIFAHYPHVEHVTSAFVWLAHGDIAATTFDRVHLDHIWDTLYPRLRAVQATVDLGVYKAKPSGLCRFCPAGRICPSAR